MPTEVESPLDSPTALPSRSNSLTPSTASTSNRRRRYSRSSQRSSSRRINNLKSKAISIYGREKEIEQLRNAYDLRHERQLVAVVGPAGCGKTSLIQSTFLDANATMLTSSSSEIAESNYFVQGNFDNLHQSQQQPFGPWIQASTELLRQIIDRPASETTETSSDDQNPNGPSSSEPKPHKNISILAAVIKSIKNSMEPSDLVALSSIFPMLGEVMNIQAKSQHLQEQAQHDYEPQQFNFMLIFASFLRGVVSAIQSPIVWFLDDLQLAEEDSLEVIKLLVADPQIPNVLPVVAFRPVHPDHSVALFLKKLEAADVPLITVEPVPLLATDVKEWISQEYNSQLGLFPNQLTRISHTLASNNETHGNPLMIFLCLEIMRRHPQIVHDSGGGTPLQAGKNIPSLFRFFLQTSVTDADNKEKSENSNPLVYLKIASCLGMETIDGDLLQQIVDRVTSLSSSPSNCTSANVKTFSNDDFGGIMRRRKTSEANPRVEYVFSNLIFRELVYYSMPLHERTLYHQAIAQIYQDYYEKGHVDLWSIFSQENAAISAQSQALPTETVNLKLVEAFVIHSAQAGASALEWNALTKAAQYFQTAFGVLSQCRASFWKVHSRQLNEMYCATAQVAGLLGKYDTMYPLLDEAMSQADSEPVYRLRVTNVRMKGLMAQRKYRDAIEIGLEGIRKNGERLRSHQAWESELRFIRKVMESPDKDILNVESMKDPIQLGILQVMDLLLTCALIHEGEWVPMLACRIIKKTFAYGLAKSSALALSLVGIILCLKTEDETNVALGISCTENAMIIADTVGSKWNKGRVATIYWSLASRFVKPWRLCQEPLKVSYRNCIRCGDSEFSLLCPVLSTVNMFTAGADELESVTKAMHSVYSFLNRTQHDALMRLLRPFYQVVLHLRGVSSEVDPSVLTGSIMNEDEDFLFVKNHPNSLIECSLLWCQALLSFNLHKFGKARRLIENCRGLMKKYPHIILASLQPQMEYLSATAAAKLSWKYVGRQKLNGEHKKIKSALRASIQSSLKKLRCLEKFCADNVLPQISMIRGEISALEGNSEAAIDSFQNAIDSCGSSFALADKAIFEEQAGLTLRMCSKEDQALDYLEDCCASYRAWGALIKVNHVKGNVIPDAVHEFE